MKMERQVLLAVKRVGGIRILTMRMFPNIESAKAFIADNVSNYQMLGSNMFFWHGWWIGDGHKNAFPKAFTKAEQQEVGLRVR